MKIYTKEIENCFQCPECHMDRNYTRFLCWERDNEFICWMDQEVPIPDWCPLPDKEIENF